MQLRAFEFNFSFHSDAEEKKTDRHWSRAPVVTAQRNVISLVCARAFAQATGTVVYPWPKVLSGPFIDSFQSTQRNQVLKIMAQENLALLTVFVAGAPAFLLQNVFPQARLANGSYVE